MAYPSDLVRTKNWGSEVLTDSDLEGQFDLIINWVMAALNSTTGHTHDGTSNNAPKIPVTNLTVGSQAQGDLIYASSASAWARLGAGTSGYFLKTQGAGANPTWAEVGFQTAASQSDMEAATSNTVPVTPLAMKWHPGVAKFWVIFNGTGTPAVLASHNVDSSITDNGTCDYTLSITTDFSGANYCVAGMTTLAGGAAMMVVISTDASPAAGTIRVEAYAHDNTQGTDPAKVCVVGYGDQ